MVLEKINEILKKNFVSALIFKSKKMKYIADRIIVWIKKTAIKPLLRKYEGLILRPKEKRSSSTPTSAGISNNFMFPLRSATFNKYPATIKPIKIGRDKILKIIPKQIAPVIQKNMVSII